MKQYLLKTSSILVVVPLLTGCVADLEQRIKKLETGLNDMRSFQAEQTSQITYLQSELRKLTGKTEEIEYTQNQKYGTDLNALKQDLSTLKRRVPPPALVPLLPLEEDEAIAERSGLTQLTDALLDLREGNYREAMPKLQELLQSGPADAQPHVLFWIAVSYDGQSEYKNALQSYHDLITQFPKHRRAPLAMLREASVFERIGDAQAAKMTLGALVERYPNSPEAEQVRPRVAPQPKPQVKAPAPPPQKSATKKKK